MFEVDNYHTYNYVRAKLAIETIWAADTELVGLYQAKQTAPATCNNNHQGLYNNLGQSPDVKQL